VTRLNRGGPLRQLEALVPGLERLGWSGPVLAGRVEPHEPDGAGDLARAGARVVRISSLARGIDPGADARALREILRHVRRVRPDVVHTHMGKAGALGRVAARLAGVPAVHTFHGHHLGAPGAAGRAARLAERALGRLTACAVCLSERQRADLVERHRVLPAEKVRVVGPGIDVHRYVESARAALPQRDGRPLLLWVGRFVAVKDPRLLVDALAASTTRPRVVMLGSGPLHDDVIRRARDLGLAGALECPGPVEGTGPWMASADALVLTSRSEGTPIAILEAQVLGKTVVATSVGGVPDLVRDGVDGLLVPPGDVLAMGAAIDRVASDAALRERLGAAAATRSRALYDGARLCRETAELYESV
jgi:glycosyltransferase involved in cell wall biosynthesis